LLTIYKNVHPIGIMILLARNESMSCCIWHLWRINFSNYFHFHASL